MGDGTRRTGDRTGFASRAGTVPGGGRCAMGSAGERVDWDGLMRLGLGALRLPPDQFWAMTPLEFIRALEGAGLRPVPGLAMDRGVLETLMAANPDRARSE